MNKVYELVTNQIIEMLEEGAIPWRKRWVSVPPQNGMTRRPYRGLNVMLLQNAGKSSPFWLTYNQARKMGGHVNAGAKSQMVVFWKRVERGTGEFEDDGVNEIVKSSFILRYFRLFNLEDVTLPDDKIPVLDVPDREVSKIDRAEQIINDWETRPTIKEGDGGAFYIPSEDTVVVPHQKNFNMDEDFYKTLWHELIHSTGAPKRLNRFTENEDKEVFGLHSYSGEELVAEIGASFLNGHLGIEQDEVMENSVAYIKGWLKRFKDDKKMIVMAASRAQKAVDYILAGGKIDDSGQDEAEDD